MEQPLQRIFKGILYKLNEENQYTSALKYLYFIHLTLECVAQTTIPHIYRKMFIILSLPIKN